MVSPVVGQLLTAAVRWLLLFLRVEEEGETHASLYAWKKTPNIYGPTDRSLVSTRRSDLTKSPFVYA